MKISSAHGVQKLRMSPGRSGSVDPLVRDRLREVQDAYAVVEDGGARLLDMQIARLDLSEMCEQIRFDGVAALNQRAQSGRERGTGNAAKGRCHGTTSSGPAG